MYWTMDNGQFHYAYYFILLTDEIFPVVVLQQADGVTGMHNYRHDGNVET